MVSELGLRAVWVFLGDATARARAHVSLVERAPRPVCVEGGRGGGRDFEKTPARCVWGAERVLQGDAHGADPATNRLASCARRRARHHPSLTPSLFSPQVCGIWVHDGECSEEHRECARTFDSHHLGVVSSLRFGTMESVLEKPKDRDARVRALSIVLVSTLVAQPLDQNKKSEFQIDPLDAAPRLCSNESKRNVSTSSYPPIAVEICVSFSTRTCLVSRPIRLRSRVPTYSRRST